MSDGYVVENGKIVSTYGGYNAAFLGAGDDTVFAEGGAGLMVVV